MCWYRKNRARISALLSHSSSFYVQFIIGSYIYFIAEAFIFIRIPSNFFYAPMGLYIDEQNIYDE